MRFNNPEYLFLLFLLVPMIIIYIRELYKADASIQISSIKQLLTYPKSKRMKFMHFPFALRVLAVASLVFALARPQLSNSWRTENSEGIDIMIAMDISGTMMAEDFKPNRLEASKEVATEFILSRPQDNIGLVVFAAESFTQCPLTTDHAVLVNLFTGVEYGLIKDGTAIGLGLANAVNRIKESKAKSKVVILLTDGSNNSGEIAPLTAAEIAKTYGVRVYAIGVGSYGKVNVPVQTALGVQYQQMDLEFDEVSLQRIASATGGKYFRATDASKLRSIYDEIDLLEKTRINVREYNKKNEVFYLFAIVAFVLLVVEIILRNTLLKKFL